MTYLESLHVQTIRPECNDLGLEQFATSVAALAGDTTAPIAALEKAIASFVENLNAMYGADTYNKERLLHEKAKELGFEDLTEFRRRLERMIGERMIELHISSRLSTLKQSFRMHA